jgi:hypothetical protein
MKNKLILFLILLSYLGLNSCGKGSRPNVTFIGDLQEESQVKAKDGSYIYSHFLNVERVKMYNERKLKPTLIVAELSLNHLQGFKKLVEKANDLKYRLFEGDSSELVCEKIDSALMVLVGLNLTITDNAGKKVVGVKDFRIPNQVGTAKFPYVTDTTNLNGKCISASLNITSVINNEKNLYFKNLKLVIQNNPSVFTKEQKYKLHFRVFDKVDPNRYFEGETLFTAY